MSAQGMTGYRLFSPPKFEIISLKQYREHIRNLLTVNLLATKVIPRLSEPN